MLVCFAVPQRASGFSLDHHFPRLTAPLLYLNPALHILEKKFHFWPPWRWPTLLRPPRVPSVRLICHHGRMSIDRERPTRKSARRKQGIAKERDAGGCAQTVRLLRARRDRPRRRRAAERG